MKNIIIGPVGSGKTYELLKLAHDADKIIVCRHEADASALVTLAKKAGFKIYHPITYNILHNFKPSVNLEYLIDDLDSFFEYVYNLKITAVTIDEENLTVLENRLKKYKYTIETESGNSSVSGSVRATSFDEAYKKVSDIIYTNSLGKKLQFSIHSLQCIE